MLYEACQNVRDRFVATGAPGSGKTPILRELVRFGFLGVNEPAREILAEQRAIGSNGVYDKDPQLFCDLMLERAIADYQRLRALVSQPSSIRASPTCRLCRNLRARHLRGLGCLAALPIRRRRVCLTGLA